MKFLFPVPLEQLPSQCLLHEDPKHNCQDCVWWILRQKDKRKKDISMFSNEKQRYMQNSVEDKYGYLLAQEEGELVGLAQFGPKKAFKHLEDLKKGSTNTEDWIVVCLQARGNDESIKQEMLKYILSHIKKTSPTVPRVIASVLKDQNIKKVSSAGSAEVFLSAGFSIEHEIDKDFVLVEHVIGD